MALSRRLIYTLVPYCSEAELVNEAMCARVLESDEHHRPGYTHNTLEKLFEGSRTLWVRNAYYPDAVALRQELEAMKDEELLRREDEIMARAFAEVRDDTARNRREAMAIEMLVDVAPEA